MYLLFATFAYQITLFLAVILDTRDSRPSGLHSEVNARPLVAYISIQATSPRRYRAARKYGRRSIKPSIPLLPSWAYRVSVKSLFIFVILDETLRSIVRSPISTTNPPLMSGLTCGTSQHSLGADVFSRRTLGITFNFLP